MPADVQPNSHPTGCVKLPAIVRLPLSSHSFHKPPNTLKVMIEAPQCPLRHTETQVSDMQERVPGAINNDQQHWPESMR